MQYAQIYNARLHTAHTCRKWARKVGQFIPEFTCYRNCLLLTYYWGDDSNLLQKKLYATNMSMINI